MISSSGLRCDVCNKYILFKECQPFQPQGVTEELHAHESCVGTVKEAMKKQDWTILPEGRLKTFWRECDEKGILNKKRKTP